MWLKLTPGSTNFAVNTEVVDFIKLVQFNGLWYIEASSGNKLDLPGFSSKEAAAEKALSLFGVIDPNVIP